MYVVLQTCVDRSSVHHRPIQEVNLNCYFLLQKQTEFKSKFLVHYKIPIQYCSSSWSITKQKMHELQNIQKPSNLPEVLSIPLGLRLPFSQHGFPYWGTLYKSGTKGLVTNFSLDSKSVPAIEGAWTLCLSQLKCKTLLKKKLSTVWIELQL